MSDHIEAESPMTRAWVEKYLTKPSRILIISEDEIADVIASSLDGYECEIVRAQTVTRAAYLVRTHKFDVIFLDMCLPEHGSQDVVRQIRFHCPETPLILLTSFMDASVLEEASKLGVVSFMKRPTARVPELCTQLFGVFKIRAVPAFTAA